MRGSNCEEEPGSSLLQIRHLTKSYLACLAGPTHVLHPTSAAFHQFLLNYVNSPWGMRDVGNRPSPKTTVYSASKTSLTS